MPLCIISIHVILKAEMADGETKWMEVHRGA